MRQSDGGFCKLTTTKVTKYFRYLILFRDSNISPIWFEFDFLHLSKNICLA